MKALFELLPSDIGRPIAHFAQRFSGGDMVEDAKEVLARLAPTDTEALTDSGRWYIRHMLPYRTDDDRIHGVVVSFTDITVRKNWEQQIHHAKEFAESIVDTVRMPLLVLTPDLSVQSANKAFLRWFQVNREETEGQLIFKLGNRQWDTPELRRLLLDVLPTDNQFDGFEVEHDFETIGRRTMLLNGRRLDNVQLILLAIEDITERKRAAVEQELLARELSHRVKNTFAVVQALALHTGRHASSVEAYRERFLGRLRRTPCCSTPTGNTPMSGPWPKTRSMRIASITPKRSKLPATRSLSPPDTPWGSASSCMSWAPMPRSLGRCLLTRAACGFSGRSRPATPVAASDWNGASGTDRGSRLPLPTGGSGQI